MVVEKIIGNIYEMDINGRKIDKVFLEWFELDKKLLKKVSESGEEIGIRVDERLEEGSILYMDEDRVIVTELLPCELSVMKVETMQQMGRLCFEIGNRHLSLSIKENQVAVVYDEPTFIYLEKLGFSPEKKLEKFSDFTVCNAHSGGHAHSIDNGHSGEHAHDH